MINIEQLEMAVQKPLHTSVAAIRLYQEGLKKIGSQSDLALTKLQMSWTDNERPNRREKVIGLGKVY